jgi:hypothetical protein
MIATVKAEREDENKSAAATRYDGRSAERGRRDSCPNPAQPRQAAGRGISDCRRAALSQPGGPGRPLGTTARRVPRAVRTV